MKTNIENKFNMDLEVLTSAECFCFLFILTPVSTLAHTPYRCSGRCWQWVHTLTGVCVSAALGPSASQSSQPGALLKSPRMLWCTTAAGSSGSMASAWSQLRKLSREPACLFQSLPDSISSRSFRRPSSLCQVQCLIHAYSSPLLLLNTFNRRLGLLGEEEGISSFCCLVCS